MEQAWNSSRSDVVHDPRHTHALLIILGMQSRTCAVCGLRWTWRVHICVDTDCSYTQCTSSFSALELTRQRTEAEI